MTLKLFTILILCASLSSYAQEAQKEIPYLMGVKTSEGLLVVVNGSSGHYTFLLTGNEIEHPKPEEDVFIVDNEVVVFHALSVASLKEEYQTKDSSEISLLQMHASGELEYFEKLLSHKLTARYTPFHLLCGAPALYWHFAAPEDMAAKGIKKQLYVSAIFDDLLLLMNTVQSGAQEEEELRQFLVSILNTVRTSARTINPYAIADSVKVHAR